MKAIMKGLFICFALCIFAITPIKTKAAYVPTNEAYTLVDYLNNKVGESFTANRCQAFVYQSVGNSIGVWASKACAYEAWQAWGVSTSKDIPLGAAVYFSGGSYPCGDHIAGHVGLYVGDGYVVHVAQSKVQKTLVSAIESWSGYSYLGWGWQGGYALAYTHPTATLSIDRASTNYNPGDVVTFTFGGNNSGTYTLGIYKGTERIDTVTVVGNTYTRTFTDVAMYSAYMTAYNDYTYADSNWVAWQVNDLTSDLSIDKSKILKNDTITFTFGGNNSGTYANGEYTLGIYKDEERIDTITVKGTTYTRNFSEAGTYKAYMTAYSNTELKDSNWVYWTVTADKPTKPVIKSAQKVYGVGDAVVLTWDTVDNASSYWLHIWTSTEDFLSQEVSGNTFTLSDLQEENYTAFLTSCNSNGQTTSDAFEFIVTKNYPDKATVQSNKKLYDVGETVVLTWNAVSNTNGYWLHIWTSTEDFMSQNVVGNSIALENLAQEKYTAFLTTYNSNGQTTSKVYEFHVGKYKIDFSANGGTDSPATQIKGYKENITLSDTKPTKEGHSFICWNTKADGSGISYNSGDIYTENEDLILYAQWEAEPAYTSSTVTKTGTKFTVNTQLHNFDSSCDLVAAGYKNKKFVTMKRVLHSEQNAPYTLEGDIDEIKVMVWDSLTGLNPLCEAEEIPSSKWVTQ